MYISVLVFNIAELETIAIDAEFFKISLKYIIFYINIVKYLYHYYFILIFTSYSRVYLCKVCCTLVTVSFTDQ